jgi:hypothetical protein
MNNNNILTQESNSNFFSRHDVINQMAQVLGINEAQFIKQLHYWLNRKTTGVIIDGQKYIYNACVKWVREQFSWLSTSSFYRVTRKLRDWGIVEFCKPLAKQRDQTGFYRINYDVLQMVMGDRIDIANQTVSPPENTVVDDFSLTQVTLFALSRCSYISNITSQALTKTATASENISSVEGEKITKGNNLPKTNSTHLDGSKNDQSEDATQIPGSGINPPYVEQKVNQKADNTNTNSEASKKACREQVAAEAKRIMAQRELAQREQAQLQAEADESAERLRAAWTEVEPPQPMTKSDQPPVNQPVEPQTQSSKPSVAQSVQKPKTRSDKPSALPIKPRTQQGVIPARERPAVERRVASPRAFRGSDSVDPFKKPIKKSDQKPINKSDKKSVSKNQFKIKNSNWESHLDQLDTLGVPLNKTVVSMVKFHSTQEVEAAIEIYKYRKRNSHIKNPSGYFVQAIKQNWAGNYRWQKENLKDEEIDENTVFRYWYEMARELGDCQKWEYRDDGVRWIDMNGVWESWYLLLERGITPEYLRRKLDRYRNP